MSQEDYREKIEEHRQAINIESEQETNPSRITRSQLHGNKKKEKNSKNRLVTILAIIFILLPMSTFLYFSYLAPEEDSEKTEIDHDGVKIETNDDNQSKKATNTSKNEDNEQIAKEKAENAAKEKEQEKIAKEKAAQEKAEKEKAEKVAAEKRAAQEKVQRKRAEQAAKDEAVEKEKQQQVYNEAKAAGRLYNVKPGETIESISMKFYGSNAGVAIIKAANGITGDSVPVGTTIAIPAQ